MKYSYRKLSMNMVKPPDLTTVHREDREQRNINDAEDIINKVQIIGNITGRMTWFLQ